MGKPKIGLQLYTVRTELEKDFEGTLRAIAALGIEGVEFAGYYGRTPSQIKQLMDELNLVTIASHVGIEGLEDNFDEEVEYLTTLRGKYAICPYLSEDRRADRAALDATLKSFEKVQAALLEKGIQFGYHNHDFEFRQSIDDVFVFDAIFQNHEQFVVELDMCWVEVAGQKAADYLNKYQGRTPLVHLKDMKRISDNQVQTVPLGSGELPLSDMMNVCEETDVEWMIIEQDECQGAPLDNIATSVEWLRRTYLQGVN